MKNLFLARSGSSFLLANYTKYFMVLRTSHEDEAYPHIYRKGNIMELDKDERITWKKEMVQ